MHDNSIIDELEFDPSSGTLTFKGVRYLLIRPETVTGFQKAVEEVEGDAAGDLLYQGGFAGGYMSAKKYKETFVFSDREIIDFMMKMGTEIGWGRLELDRYDFTTKQLKISVKNSVFAESYGASRTGVCHLIRGVTAGMASFLFGTKCIAVETKCISIGDNICTFVVKRDT
jgi:predicted hydrocarbon binding protein